MEELTLLNFFNKKSECKWSSDVYRFFDSEVADESEAKKIAEHIESCQRCKDMLTEHEKIRSALRPSDENNLVENDKLSETLNNILHRIEHKKSFGTKLV